MAFRRNKNKDENIEIIEPEIISPDNEELYSENIDSDDIDASYDSSDVIIEEKLSKKANKTKEASALTTTDPLSLYIAEVSKYALITREEEHDLAVKYRRDGDQEAAEKLVTSNLRFVIKVAAEYAKYGAKMIDLIQEGNVGLMHAVKEFDPDKGVRLITYAVWWIKGYIREYLLRQYSVVRIGTTSEQKKLFHQLRREQQKVDALGQEMDVKQISGKLGVTEKAVTNMQQRLGNKDVSLDQSLDSESNTQLIDMQYDPNQKLQDDTLGDKKMVGLLNEKIDKLRDSLNEKELYILVNRILANDPMTLQQIGDHFKITRERTRQLEARIIKRLKLDFFEELGEQL